MRKISAVLLLPLTLLAFTAQAADRPVEKEWTFLVFLNGHNNLDSFGAQDINEMEKVGSTNNINVVVQWASYAATNTKRLLVKKDSDPNKVTSPVVQTLPRVDMGDYKSLIEFVRWAHENYPAKHYFIDVWNHGNGWHFNGNIKPMDISWDDKTGNKITTEQLGDAMRESARIIGHKVDIYGSDACLMAMAEVAGEMADSVQTFVGSQDLEPGPGWAYDGLLADWVAAGNPTSLEIGKILADTYRKSYQGGTQGNQDVTMSVFDLNQWDKLTKAFTSLGTKLAALSATDKAKVKKAISSTLSFTNSDYGDALDFLGLVEKSGIVALDNTVYAEVKDASKAFVTTNLVTAGWAKAQGLSFWLPKDKYSYNQYQQRYRGLRFAKDTKWADAMQVLVGQ